MPWKDGLYIETGPRVSVLDTDNTMFRFIVPGSAWPEIVSSLKCTWYFCIFVLFCLNKFFTVYHYNTLSLFSLKAGGRQVDDIFVAVSIVICRSTNCGATGGAVSLTIFCFSELDYHDIQTRFYCDTYIIGMYMISLYNCFLCFDNLSAISL